MKRSLWTPKGPQSCAKPNCHMILGAFKANPHTARLPCNIVVRGANWVGDTIMSLPALKAVRRIFPLARITYWGPSATTSLLTASGILDEALPLYANSGSLLFRPFRMGNRLAHGQFDMVVLFQNAFESAFTSWLSGIPLRAGYPTDCRGPLLNLKAPMPPGIRRKHQVYYYLAIADFLEAHFQGSVSKPEVQPDCSTTIPDEELSEACKLLASGGLDMDRPIFCLCPGSVNSEAKRWPKGSFARLADLLASHGDGQVVFVGAPQEASLIDEIIQMTRSQDAVNLAGKTNLIMTMSVMALSTMVISNDTGSAHLAAAASSPVLTIFGPTSAGVTAPFGAKTHIIQGEAPCAPCRYYQCPKPEHLCMRSIEPEAVFSLVETILSGSEN